MVRNKYRELKLKLFKIVKIYCNNYLENEIIAFSKAVDYSIQYIIHNISNVDSEKQFLIHYLVRIHYHIHTLSRYDITDARHYQSIWHIFRSMLELCTDIDLIINNKIDSNVHLTHERIRAWQLCAKAKLGNIILNKYGNKIPSDKLFTVAFAQNAKLKYPVYKNKYQWYELDKTKLPGKFRLPSYWHGLTLEKAIENTQNDNLVRKAYSEFYPMMNWAIHGSGYIIQDSFSPAHLEKYNQQVVYIICGMAATTLVQVMEFFGLKTLLKLEQTMNGILPLMIRK